LPMSLDTLTLHKGFIEYRNFVFNMLGLYAHVDSGEIVPSHFVRNLEIDKRVKW
jgi:hypothetical protein